MQMWIPQSPSVRSVAAERCVGHRAIATATILSRLSQVLSELPVAEDLIAALPPNARTALGPQLYRLVGTAVARTHARDARAALAASQRMLVVR
jgi:hypothetical protein